MRCAVIAQGSDPAPAQSGEKRRSAPRLRMPARLGSHPEPQQPSSATAPDRQALGEGTGVRQPPPPKHTPTAGEEAAKVTARHQRLLALQRGLAHLKKTPSLHLLARQRIPRLEAEIKHLVCALQERA